MFSKAFFATFLLLFVSYTSAQTDTNIDYSGSSPSIDTTTYTETSITTMISSVATTQCTPAQSLFSTSGTTIRNQDDNYEHFCFPIDVPLGNSLLDCVYIYMNGLISSKPTFNHQPRTLATDDVYTFAPFWADIDIRNGGSLTYSSVEKYPESRKQKDEILLNSINTFINEKGNIANFDTVYALIVTWTDVLPHLAHASEKRLTFQAVLATDGTYTYLVYIYDTCNANWDFQYPVLMGYASTSVYNNIDSLSDTIISNSLLTGNSGTATWVFLMSSDSPANYKLECLKWHWNNIDVTFSNLNQRSQCPCNEETIQQDIFYSKQEECYVLSMASLGNGKICCYDANTGSLSRGNVQLYMSSHESYVVEDQQPYEHCCIKSNYCHLYYENRPQDTCSSWRQLSFATTFGDPHFSTLDGKSFTFNGYGEFELLNIFNSTDKKKIMSLQCRTRNISSGKATVFEAFAFKTTETQVQIMTSLNAQTVVITEGGTELTPFQSDPNFQWLNKGVFIRKQRSNPNITVIVFSNGIAAAIEFTNKILQFSVSVAIDKSLIYTNGLLGTFNGNTSDDFQRPDKSVIPIDSSEEFIYKNFGLYWSTNQSIFNYENDKNATSYQYPNYLPTFWNEDFLNNQTVKDFCDDKQDCIFDYLQTKNIAIASDTLEVTKDIVKINLLKEYSNPLINGTKDVLLSVDEFRTLEFRIDYDIRLNLTLNVVDNDSSVITMSNGTVQVNLTAPSNNASIVSASFYITTDKGHKTAIFTLNIIVCPNCVNGTCDASNEFSKTSKTSRYLPCACERGWTGDDCSEDYRCAPFPCKKGIPGICECDCPTGYEYKDDKCVDINECTTTFPCEMNCLNTIGSFYCSCDDGYLLLNATNCTDINECDGVHGCDHECQNQLGSYSCSCFDGYNLTADKKTCKKKPGLSCTSCDIYHGCKADVNNTCFCKLGYNKNSTGCHDIDECSDNTHKCGEAKCNNTGGSYTCYCDDGYTYDKSERKCADCPKDKWGPNCINSCNSVHCDSCNKTTGCVCKVGTTGTSCSEDIDECQLKFCDSVTTNCRNIFGSYTCDCKPGYKKFTDTICEDIDECTLGSHNCSPNANCGNVKGSYDCICKEGFIGNGFNCTDIDECRSDTSLCMHTCENILGSYACKCNTQYKIADDRRSCLYDGSDTCILGTHNCSSNATCSSSKGNYTCICNKGFEGDGFKCRVVPDMFHEYLIYVLVGTITGFLVLMCIMIFCIWCCCFGGYRRYRSRHEALESTLDYDPYNVQQGFGSLSSTFTGKRGGRYYFGNFLGTKYLRNWAEFSPDSGDEPIPETSAESETQGQISNIRDSRWQRVLHKINNTDVFHIQRPEVSTRSYYT